MSDVEAGSDNELDRARVPREALIGQWIAGRYRLCALVGHGGMGAVYEAEHLELGTRVAIKLVDPEWAADQRVAARFAREAQAMSSIDSPHIVSVEGAGSENGRPYIVMELLRGEDLGERLRKEHRLPVGEALHVVAQILKGLSRAHSAGIVHRDLKPDNVFVVKGQTDPLFAKIVDFGISKIERPRDRTSPLALTGRGTVLGTPFYMCPEQAQAMPDVDARADLYSVGAILFECLTGRPPHTGETYEQVILSICMCDAVDVRVIDPTLAPEVADFVARALRRDRAARFASADRMLAALHTIAPVERTRVPLDASAIETLMSAGIATKIAGSFVAPRPPEAHRPSATSAPASVASSPPAKPRSPVLLTAVLATLTGVVVMLAVVGVGSRNAAPTTPEHGAVALTSAVPHALPTESAPPPPSATAIEEKAVAPPASLPATPRAVRVPPRPSASKLDISRDLP